MSKLFFFFSFLKDLFIFRERRKEGEREGEKQQCVVASHVPPTGDLAHNPGMCPVWESNLQPFGQQSGVQSTELHQPGPNVKIVMQSMGDMQQVRTQIYYPIREIQTNPQHQKGRSVVVWGLGGLRKSGLQRGTRKLLVVRDIFTILMMVMVSQMYIYVKMNQTVYFKYVLV